MSFKEVFKTEKVQILVDSLTGDVELGWFKKNCSTYEQYLLRKVSMYWEEDEIKIPYEGFTDYEITILNKIFQGGIDEK